ncbi:hypothetical protein, partial [Aeromonas caviae]|uniref:hypothetical protein n=1 Tax=Aeromonas caviae TaxID=648 RepID=UPI001FC86131
DPVLQPEASSPGAKDENTGAGLCRSRLVVQERLGHYSQALPCLNTRPHWVNVAGVQGIYRVPERSVCDERYSQPVNGWLKKVGVPNFLWANCCVEIIDRNQNPPVMGDFDFFT